MNLHDISPPDGSNQDAERKGRGRGASRGESCGRGNKGQKKRNTVPIYFEGGQTPIYRRFPKRGFNSQNSVDYEEVNVSSLNQFSDGDTIEPDDLKEAGLVNDTEQIKLLGDGTLEVSLTIQVHAASSGAEDKIANQDGDLIRIDS